MSDMFYRQLDTIKLPLSASRCLPEDHPGEVCPQSYTESVILFFTTYTSTYHLVKMSYWCILSIYIYIYMHLWQQVQPQSCAGEPRRQGQKTEAKISGGRFHCRHRLFQPVDLQRGRSLTIKHLWMHSQPSNMGIYCAKMGIEPSNLGGRTTRKWSCFSKHEWNYQKSWDESHEFGIHLHKFEHYLEVMVHFFNLGIDYPWNRDHGYSGNANEEPSE